MSQDSILQVYPYLRVRNADAAISFHKNVFGAEEKFRLTEPGGRVGHAELLFGPAIVMVSDEYPECGVRGPEAFGGSGSSVHLHVEDVDAMTRRTVETGVELLMEPTDQFYGERAAKVLDPFGHEWLLGSQTESQIEDVTPEEMRRRFAAVRGDNG